MNSNLLAIFPLGLGLAACGGDSGKSSESDEPLPVSAAGIPAPLNTDQAYAPAVQTAQLSADITNPLLPFAVGARWTYEADTPDGLERIEITVEAEARDTWGAPARVVRDTVTIDGELAEDTWDWYAQDEAGNVWYVGEDTAEYEDGKVTCHCGAWEAGKGGALPGVTMLAAPKVGDVYRQEYLSGEAEDYATVVALNETVSVAAGKFTGCVKTREQSVLDRELDEFKYFCPLVGLTLVLEGDVRVELIEYAAP